MKTTSNYQILLDRSGNLQICQAEYNGEALVRYIVHPRLTVRGDTREEIVARLNKLLADIEELPILEEPGPKEPESVEPRQFTPQELGAALASNSKELPWKLTRFLESFGLGGVSRWFRLDEDD